MYTLLIYPAICHVSNVKGFNTVFDTELCRSPRSQMQFDRMEREGDSNSRVEGKGDDHVKDRRTVYLSNNGIIPNMSYLSTI